MPTFPTLCITGNSINPSEKDENGGTISPSYQQKLTEHLLFFADDPRTSCNSTQEFLCENRICLSRDLTCDQYNNCQDETASDESRNWEVCGRYAKSKSKFK